MIARFGLVLTLALCASIPIADAKVHHNARNRGKHGSRGNDSCSKSLSSGTEACTTAAETTAATTGISSDTEKGDATATGSASGSASGASASASASASSGTYWKPTVGTTFQILLASPLAQADMDLDVGVYDIDLFGNTAETISSLQSSGKKVMCYFSAGCYTSNAPDASDFSSSDFGSEVSGYPGEYWLNINSDSIRSIMVGRFDIAVSKGCDGVDMDNVDIFQQSTGLSITEADTSDYLNYLAEQAHSRGLGLGLKNAGQIVSSVIDNMDWCINESCTAQGNCDMYSPFITASKPVFHIEYPGTTTMTSGDFDSTITEKYCSTSGGASGFVTDLKNLSLDSWVQFCDSSTSSDSADSSS